jgi:hypothetical protein
MVMLAGVVRGERVAKLVSVEVSHDDGVYRLESVTQFTAPPAAVFAVLSDYTQFTRISGAFVDSGMLAEPAPDGRPRVHTTVRGCVLFYCRDLRRVEQLETRGEREIITRVEPALSDFREGLSHWRLSPLEEGGTRVDFSMHMRPAFWVPPLIGPALVKRRLVRDGVDAVARIDALAHERVQAAP